jgi:fermentation-respiration switch protein FrsA (DUF1100 family)
MRLGPLAPILTPLLLVQLYPLVAHVLARPGADSLHFPIGSPVLVVAGSRDKHTTLAESEELFRAAVQPKRCGW